MPRPLDCKQKCHRPLSINNLKRKLLIRQFSLFFLSHGLEYNVLFGCFSHAARTPPYGMMKQWMDGTGLLGRTSRGPGNITLPQFRVTKLKYNPRYCLNNSTLFVTDYLYPKQSRNLGIIDDKINGTVFSTFSLISPVPVTQDLSLWVALPKRMRVNLCKQRF